MATIRRKKSEPFAIVQKDPGPWPQVLINWLATLAVIIVFGLIMLFSASYTTGYLRMGDSFYYIKSQMFCLGLGLGAMLLFSRIDHRFLRRLVWPGYFICILMLIAVLFSAPLNGCRRWLRVAGVTVQVSEIAKFEMILLTTHLAAKAPHLEKLDPSSPRRIPVRKWLYQRIVRELVIPLLPLIPVVGRPSWAPSSCWAAAAASSHGRVPASAQACCRRCWGISTPSPTCRAASTAGRMTLPR